MQLGTFGAILKYGIEIEDGAAGYYESLALLASGETKNLVCEMTVASKKNKQILERTRRMEMQEMILEAISGLDTAKYDTNFEPPKDLKSGLSRAFEMEKKSVFFYNDSASKLDFLGNVKRTLEKLGKEREVRAEKILACL